MRNLKKVLSLIVVVAMLLTAMVPAFAAGTASVSADAKAMADIGMLLGDGKGVTAEYTATTLTRVQAAVLLLRLKGLAEEAKNFTGKDNFADVDASAWFAPYTAYLKANPALGFIGDGKNFNADQKISAQQYYKVVLTALGYVEGEGKDYTYAKTVEFAKSKGLVKVTGEELTVDGLATATVEGLKAAVKGGTKTLAATLVEAGKINAAKAETAGVYKKVTQGIEVTNGAKTITVKFNVAPTAPTFTVTRDAGIAVSATFTADAKDNTKYVYTAGGNLVAGEYTVAVKDDTTDLGSKTLTLKDEKVAGIEITSKQIIRKNDTAGFVNYKVTNQYGEDITKNASASGLNWSTSLSTTYTSITEDKGTLEISYNDTTSTSYLAKLRDYTTTPIAISVYDRETGIVCNKSLTVSVAVGDIQSIELKGIYNKDGKKDIVRNNNVDEFFVDFEIKDSNGELVTNYEVLGNALQLYPDAAPFDGSAAASINIAGVKIKQDPADTKKALFQIVLRANPNMSNAYEGVGVQPINFISKGTGKSATINVEVKDKNTELSSFVLQRPTADVTAGSEYVEIPYVATDADGNAITAYSSIQGKIELSPSANFKEVPMADGTYKLFYNFSGKAKDAVENLTATVKRTFKYSNVSITVKEVSVPKTITKLPFDLYMTPGASSVVGFYDGKMQVVDKYGNAVNLENYIADDGKDYFIVPQVLSTNNAFTASGIAYGPAKADRITVLAGTNAGSADIKFHLFSKPTGTALPVDYNAAKAAADASTTDAYAKIDDKVLTFYNVDPKDISSYAIEDITDTLYADASVIPLTDSMYRAEVKVRGILSSGTKVILPTVSVTAGTYGIITGSYSVSDTANFAFDATVANKVYAKSVDTNKTEATATVSALVKGHNNVVYTVSKAIKSSNAAPVAQTAEVKIASAARTATSITEQKVVKKAENYYEVALADASVIVGKTLNARGTSELKFRFKDQYAENEVVDPASIYVVSSTGGKYSMSGYTLNATSVAAGDEIVLSATRDGKVITVTVKIN